MQSIAGREQKESERKTRNSCLPAYWQWRWLRYTPHAQEQAETRGIPLLSRLPVDHARLVDVDLGWRGVVATIWKFIGTDEHGTGAHFLVLRSSGEVLTVFYADESWPGVCDRKENRRQLLARLDYGFITERLNCQEAQQAVAAIDLFWSEMAEYADQCAVKQTGKRRARRDSTTRNKKRGKHHDFRF